MVARRKGMVVLWLELATILVATTGSPLQRNRRIVNEPGDIPNLGNTTLPYNKRQQIIYLLNKDNQSKRDKEPGRTVSMENYAKELSPDGRVVIPNASRLLLSEDFHRGRYKETAVNKGDGPPNLIKAGKTSGKTDSKGTASTGQTDRTGSASSGQTDRKASALQLHQQHINSVVKKSGSVQVKVPKAKKLSNGNNNDPQKRTKTYGLESHNHKSSYSHIKFHNKLNEDSSSTLRKKDSFIRPVGRLFDGEILPPAKPIQPNVFEFGQDDIGDSHRRHYNREGLRPYSGVDRAMLPEERPARRWRHRHHYYHRRPAPLVMGQRPSMYYMPMYSGRSYAPIVQFAAPNQDIHSAPLIDPRQQPPLDDYDRQPVMMQPVLPLMSSSAAQQGVPLLPSQPVLQSPFVQQPADDRSSLYTVPMATAPQQPQQQVVYPIMALPAVPQPQPQVQLVQQPAIEQGMRFEQLPRHWSDEPGHARSEVSEDDISKPREYDDEERYENDGRDSRYDEDRYQEYRKDERMNERMNERANERMDVRRYHDDRDSFRDEEEREAERERLYREREYYDNSDAEYPDTRYSEENARARARSLPAPVPTALEEASDDDDEEENESEESERNLQDSREEPPPANEGPPEIERDENSPNMNYHLPNMESREQPSVLRIPPYASPDLGMPLPYNYPNRLSADTYSREQLLGPSVPLRQRILPRFMNSAPRMTPIHSPGGEISEMSASEARFRERMRLELQAKDKIPRGFHSDLNEDGLKNVVLRLNGEPLENASELRSKIINGRVIQGKGKVIKSKGPMRIRVTHKGKGRNRVKFIDIISPEKYSITDSRSKIGRVPTMTVPSLNLQRNKIHRKDSNGSDFNLSAEDITSMTNTTRNTKAHDLQSKKIKSKHN